MVAGQTGLPVLQAVVVVPKPGPVITLLLLMVVQIVQVPLPKPAIPKVVLHNAQLLVAKLLLQAAPIKVKELRPVNLNSPLVELWSVLHHHLHHHLHLHLEQCR